MTGRWTTQLCACRVRRIPYLLNAATGADGRIHRTTRCDPVEPVAPSPTPRPWSVLATTCEHGEALFVTGPEPSALLERLGCGCA
jgi:hypothetical protein